MTLPAEYFDQMYARSSDPWQFETRWYERRKYDVTLAALPKPRFRNGFEPGCSIGVLTERLVDRCDRLLATDVSESAVDAARSRLAGRTGVTVEQRAVPDSWPDDEYDLIVLSELGYYFHRTDLARLVDCTVATLATDGVLVAVHWRHPVADYPLSGDAVHQLIRERSGLACAVEHVEADFRLDVLVRPGTPSVASVEGLTS
jgi:SAM-dependent methyltransferase